MYVMKTCGPSGSCSSSSCGEADYARALAHWAKMELLKEKVKQRIDARHGAKLDKMADLIVELVESERKSQEEMYAKEEELASQFESLGEQEE